MSLLNKLTIKNLKLNKKRTIVTIIGIILSVALITAVASMYASGIQSLINFETRQYGDFHVSFYDVPTEEINKFEDNRNIDTVNIVKGIGYAKVNSQNEYKPYAYIKALTSNSLNNLSIRLVEGRLPESANEIVIPTHLNTNGRLTLKVGDTVTLEVGKRVDYTNYELDQDNPYQMPSEDSGELLIETSEKTYKIVGIIERPANNIEPYSAPGYTFITYLSEKDISGNIDIYAKLTKEGMKNWFEVVGNILNVDANILRKMYNGESCTDEEYDKFHEQMNKAYLIDINKYLIDLETDPLSGSAISGLGAAVGVVIGIIIVTSVFCIKNSFDISITEKIKQYGMLRSIGATKKQIRKNVFYEATILGLIGIPLGIILGYFASYILVIISNYYLVDLINSGMELVFVFSPLAVLVAIILGIVTIYASAFRSARKAAKVSPIDSVRNSASIKINSKKIKSPKLIKKIFGMGGELSYKNLKRNKKKYRTTVISIIVSVFIFIALYSFMGLAYEQVELEVKSSEYNLRVGTGTVTPEIYNKFISTTKFDNIENYTIYRRRDLTIKGTHYSRDYIDFVGAEQTEEMGNYSNIVAIGEEQYKKYLKSLNLNYDDVKDKAILVDSDYISTYDNAKDKIVTKYMRQFDFEVGDVIEGSVYPDDKNLKLEIAAVTETKPFGMKNNSAGYIVISDALFDSITETDSITIYYKSDDANKLQDAIDEELKGTDYVMINSAENARMTSNLLTLVGIFLYGFIIVISLIGITNIFNTITTSMELRRQEFAMLKSVGMTKKEFGRMIRLESLFMGLKSLLFGVPIGICLSYLMYHFLSEESGVPYHLPIVAILISILAVFILISLIMKYSMDKINKQNTIETIRNENI